uniref:Uncharacterized protein n=1 Tax=Pristhesancus plagipennis TaxID=1955184 RepID=A0A2K8JPS5_PRIPG|nr:secreted hypothetical protein [Pristhesancus plagipennis]
MRSVVTLTLVQVLVLFGSASCGFLQNEGVLPLAVVGDRPLSIARTMVQVPLVLVPNNDIALYSNVHISAVSPTKPIVTCRLNQYTLDATPAVKVVLNRPVVVESQESLIPFPSSVSVAHDGLRMSIPVGALIAPIPHFLPGPQMIRVIYAIPTTPLNLRYPYYSPVPYPFRPTYEDYLFELKRPTSTAVISTPSKPISRPEDSSKPSGISATGSIPIKPIDTSDLTGLLGNKKPSNRPLITVLDFPSEVASPVSLYYQPTIEDELGNRGPPEAIIPAGIVQSTQPKPTLQLFLNAKESSLLQSLRDEAENLNRDKNNSNLNSIKVEALK